MKTADATEEQFFAGAFGTEDGDGEGIHQALSGERFIAAQADARASLAGAMAEHCVDYRSGA